jgi:hypothetical protein
VQGLADSRGTGEFTPVTTEALGNGKDGIAKLYRTFDKGSSGSPAQVSRSTFAEIFRNGTSLWAVSVTVPTEQENTAKTELYQRIVPTFTITG